jgi:predicted phosphodiesterase
MRIAIYSDLHREIEPFAAQRTDADLVVLAGDIDNGVAGVEWAQRSFDVPVLYIAGNHEFYDGEFHAVTTALAAAAAGSHVHVLDCGERVVDGVRFLGCTLWTDYSLAPEDQRATVKEQSRTRNPDYALIQFGERAFAPEDASELCARHRAWLTQQLSTPFLGTTVVITHFAPHRNSIARQFNGHPANPGFIVPLDDLMGRVPLWIHGHTHSAFDYTVQGTRVICNPRGYPEETTGFAAGCTIDLPVHG